MTVWTAPNWPSPSLRSVWLWCVRPEDAEKFIAAATAENLEAYQVAVVTEEPRMVMSWNGVNDRRPEPGLPGHATARTSTPPSPSPCWASAEAQVAVTATPSSSSQRIVERPRHGAPSSGLTERFDGIYRRGLRADALRRPSISRPRRRPWRPCCPSAPAARPRPAPSWPSASTPTAVSATPSVGAAESVVESVAKLTAAGADPQAGLPLPAGVFREAAG